MEYDPQHLIDFLYEAPTASHQVQKWSNKLKKANFEELTSETQWDLKIGGKYFIKKHHTALVAFKIGSADLKTNGLKIIAAHTDSPSFRIKANPEMVVENRYLKLNTEMYGSAISYSWFDRPLSIAGQVAIKTEHPLKPRIELLHVNRPLLTIPSVAIHLNPEVNKKFEVNHQKDTLPLLTLVSDTFQKEGYLQKLLAKKLNVSEEDILSFDLELCAQEKGTLLGLENEFLQAQGLDDKWMVYAAMQNLMNNDNLENTQMAICFDNEEIGSLTAQGAQSTFMMHILNQLLDTLGLSSLDIHEILEQSICLSADLAHGLHPNAVELYDPTNHPILGDGPVLKVAASGSYSTDATGAAIFKSLCEKANVPFQTLYNRSDKRGGTTIGPITAAALSLRVIDMGAPLLSMHAIKELGAVRDHEYIMKLFHTFYTI